MGEAVAIDRASSELIDFSPSRLATAGKCGLAFEYQYVRKLPAPYESARAVFGTVCHDGVERWYGLDGGEGFKHTDLAPIVLALWQEHLPPVVWGQVMELRDLNEECEAIAAAVLFQRPELKAPTTTKQYQAASAVIEFNEKRRKMVEGCDALPSMKWPKDEDPFKAYVKSAQIAKQMQTRWQHLPRPIAVEYPFRIEFEGFVVRGRIDQVRVDPNRTTGEAVPRVVDIKTGMQMLTQMEAFLQLYLYHEAVLAAPDLPDTSDIALYMARHDKYQQGRVDRKRHSRLASRILNGRARQIIMGQFEPSYGFWCKQCDFNDVCATEISVWEGDGIVVELLD